MIISESEPGSEPSRLAALKEYHVLAKAEQAFEDVAEVAAHICNVPMSAIWLKDAPRWWLKSKTGARKTGVASYKFLCAQTILGSTPLVIRDRRNDRRLVKYERTDRPGRPRFFAGFPLVNSDGLAMGALCVMDKSPRQLSPKQRRVMEALSRRVVTLLELKRVSALLADALGHVKTLRGLIPICAWCKRIREDDGYWSQLEAYFHTHAAADFTHSICPKCLEKERHRLHRRHPGNGK